MERKVQAGILAGSLTTIGFYVLSQAASIAPPAEVGAAATTIISFSLAWVIPNKVEMDG